MFSKKIEGIFGIFFLIGFLLTFKVIEFSMTLSQMFGLILMLFVVIIIVIDLKEIN